MNRGVYRLIFNHERNAFVAVAEHVRGRGKKTTRRRAAAVLLGLAAVAAGSGGQAIAAPPPGNALPVPASGSMPFVYRGTVTGGQPITVGNAMTINTDSRMLGLNWQSFNIGSSASVTFNQPDATSRVLNRIWSNDPSQIMGKLSANGQIYLINQNGILFGNGAQVNVGGLVASSLNLSESMASQLLNNGLPSAKGDKLEFAFDGSAAGFNAGFVTVEAGAAIRTPSGGRVVLIAPKTVENMGLIEGGGGAEAILAAGGKVILTAPDDPSLRGLLVETKSFTGRDSLGNSVTLDGTVTNKSDGVAGSDNGRIDMGNGGVVSLAALAVNQKGIVNATKAVNLNGTTMLVSGSIETDRLTVNQRGDKAEIDWVSGFNVGAGKTVEFVQSSTGAVAYNYVYDPDRKAVDGSVLNVAGKSSIDGILKASGQFFLINEKGISFGAKADVKAANFVASALGVSPTLVSDGIFAQDGVSGRAFYLSKKQLTAASDAAFASVSASARAAFADAAVVVAKGAKIATTADNGFVMLIGGTVEQNGEIRTPKGQTLLAAGADVYLRPPFAAGLRGFMAEVNPLYAVKIYDGNKWGVIDHGMVTNTGNIAAALGNISLVGFNINQLGDLWTSTSATANGSIRLLARDQLADKGLAAEGSEPPVISGQRNINSEGVAAYVANETYKADDKANQPLFAVGRAGGTVILGEGSTTTVAIDGSSGKTIAPDQSFISSLIDMIAKKIEIEGADNGKAGAQLTAHGGRIQALTSETFDLTRAFMGDPISLTQGANPPAGVGVFVGDGAKLDVSGVTARKSVSDLFIEVELRGDNFAGNPVQRNGALRGESAWVDIRDKIAIADLTGYTGKVGQTVEEKAAGGGTVSLRSTGSVVVKQQAEIDVSGGRVDYAEGYVSETSAITIGGQHFRLNDAPVSSKYVGLSTVTRKVAAYSEGKSAGTVELTGHSLAVDGNLKATTTPGAKQRNVGASSDRHAIPLGGQLIIKDAGQHYAVADRDTASEAEKMAAYTQAQIAFVRGAAHAADGLDADSTAGPLLELSSRLVDSGFSRFDIKSDGRIDVAADVALNLASGGEFKLSGRQVHIAGDITTPGGSITLSTSDMSQSAGPFPTISDAKYSTLVVENGATLSTAGRWVNDAKDGAASTAVKAIQGGKITLDSAYDIDLRAGSTLDVSGGAFVDDKAKLEAGNAGSISLTTGGMLKGGAFNFTNDLDRRDASLFLDGTLAGYALGSGGKLEINTSAVQLGSSFTDSRQWSRADRLASGQVGVALDGGFFNRGGFYEFKLVGRDGVNVVADAHIAPSPVSWSLAKVAGYRNQATGSAISSFAQPVVLHPDLRSAPTRLSLATRSLNYGDLVIGKGAYLGVSPQGSIKLESWAQLTMLGTLEAPAGTVTLSRPANRAEELYNSDSIAFSEGKQSESIFLGADSRILAGGTTKLDATARVALDAGISADALRALYRYKGEVLAGGSVDVDAGLGYLVMAKGSLIDVSGAQDRLNTPIASGANSVSYPVQAQGSAGGRIGLAAREGMFLDGGYAAAGKNGALGGIFSLRFYELASSATWDSVGLPDSMNGPRQLTLFQSRSSSTPPLQWTPDDHPLEWKLSAADTAAYLAGKKTLASGDYDGKARLDIAPLVSAGFGSWYLSTPGEMGFDGTLSATVNNQLRLDAPKFSAAGDSTSVDFTAAALQLGSYAPTAAPASSAIVGSTASAVFSARDIGISGNFSWNGFATSDFNSSGEIHFDSTANSAPNRLGGRNFSGQMTASGKVKFAAARLSPSTYSDYRVDLSSDASGSITITRPTDAVAGESLSVGGRLEFAAKKILHSGTVTAPLGEIVFSASGGKVTLDENSVTSVAADRTLILGQTDQSGRYWRFESTYWDPKTRALTSATYDVVKAPEKAIRIDAADSEVKTGAKLDLSAGGEAIAAEFTPGPGGKTDILATLVRNEAEMAAANNGAATVFAVLPGWNGQFAPQDSQAGYYNVSNPVAVKDSEGNVSYRYDSVPTLKAGDQVQLAANGSGLAAGSYTLLPARYALLPGAWLVTVKTATNSVVAGAQAQADGSWLVSGSRLAANADGSATAYSQKTQAFEVANPTVVDARARYQVTSASDFFYDTAGAKLPGDVGLLSVVGRDKLIFDPTIAALRQAEVSAADGRKRAGEGLQLDIAAKKLMVSDGAVAPDAEWSVLEQAKLIALGASSLLLGGVRSTDGEATKIETIASLLRVENKGEAEEDQSKALTGPELMLTAKDELKVVAGSRIESMGDAPRRQVVLDGDGAFLRVAEGDQAGISRTGDVKLKNGSLVVDDGATVAGKSVILDATKNDGTRNTIIDGSVLVGVVQADGTRSGGALSIGAGRINVIGDSGAPSNGLVLDKNTLAAFAKTDQLRLTSYTTLDLYGDASLGTSDLNELIIGAAGIAGHGSGEAQITAKSVVFDNPNPDSAKFDNSGLGAVTLNVTAENGISFASNVKDQAKRDAKATGFAFRGFEKVNLTTAGDVRFSGLGVTAVNNATDNGLTGGDKVIYGGNGKTAALTVNAGRVVTVGTADHLLVASDKTEIKGGVEGGGTTGLGGSLEIQGKSVDVSGRIETPSGKLTLAATGEDGGDNVTITETAVIAAKGSKVAFADTFAYAPGGEIKLTARKGDITVTTVVTEGGTEKVTKRALISVSADADGGDAGTLALIATEGKVSVGDGTLRGTAKADPSLSQGTLKVDAATVSLDELAGAVSETLSKTTTRTNLGGQWDIRSRTGSLSLSKTISASQVAIAADKGGVQIDKTGKIDASGAKGGNIELYAGGGNVNLEGNLIAKATERITVASNAGTRGQGGTVILAADGTGSVITATGSTIDVGAAPDSVATGGKVTFRAGKTNATVIKAAADVNIKLGGEITGASDVGAEIVSAYTANSLTAASLASIKGDLTTLYSETHLDKNGESVTNVDEIRKLLGFANNPIYHVRPGVEIKSSSTADFNIGTSTADLDFGSLRFPDYAGVLNEAGVLTVRAQGNLNINGTLSDGFVTNSGASPVYSAVSRDAKLSTSGNAWSYRLVAGADTAAAATLTTQAAGSLGTLQVATNKLVRTGNGSIAMAASKDIKLLDRAAVYTAGVADTTQPTGFSPAGTGTTATSIYSVFPSGGGDISLTAGERIVMVKSGETAPDKRHINQWLFRAGGETRDLQWWPRISAFQQGVAAFGGGDIALTAGTDIKNFVVAIPTNGRVPTINGQRQPDLVEVQGGGDLTVRAGGAVIGGLYYAETGKLLIDASEIKADVGIALGNTTARIVADGDVALGNVFNPLWTLAEKTANNTYSGSGSVSLASISDYDYRVRIGTYSDATAVDLVSVSGNVDLNSSALFYGVDDPQAHRLAPAKMKVAALNGNISGSLYQAPGNSGQLDLLADGAIKLGAESVKQLDVPASALPSVRNPLGDRNFELLGLLTAAPASKHAATSWHLEDSEPSRLVARRGDITGVGGRDNYAEFSEAVDIEAGGDIKNLNLTVQHLTTDSVSKIVAEGDITYTINGGALPSQGIKVNGPGRVEVIAGGSVDLADSKGIVTKGNLENPYLPVGGADIMVLAGTTSPDYAGFVKYMRDNGLPVGNDLSPNALRDRFYALLLDFGREAQSGGGDASYEKGRAVIQALFPASSVSKGNIDLFYSAVKTEQDGGIDLLAPGGSVTVGIANPSKTIPEKKAADQGLFTFQGGAIRAFVLDNFLVNQSRVFTLDGGNILVWADHGMIDAGNGAKTVSATPPPVLVVRDGQIFLDASNSISGSGIGALASRDDTPASDMDLFAPNGAIDAGDAGLRSTGRITLGAPTILNASNIQAAGGVSGAPAAATTATPVAAITSPTSAEDRMLEESPTAAGNRNTAQGMLTVEVLGGEECSEAARSKGSDDKSCNPG
ncbi:filamentous hemagglutinin N-terminal domain-containing protein [Dechloromonas denitrificans]|uniref:filamentous hemagglutinin N-terminal domain-containing protein n=1 Tax=Dechloromonas denitrificans TaxID=281362 RepID=UPI001CF85CBD|nr:filamentous hemagglutinin N-terminal domain-containing protein [Dechloromonas denitrificans]UCV05448.1 filamentous hemagglutinin N-terminal domain-containing protein [Dechloromonas denitrificans]